MNVVALSDSIGCAEGPVELGDGTFAVTSIDRGALYRLTAQGERSLLAVTGGGPNGATVGTHGSLYVAQSGGRRGAGPARRRVMTGGIQVIDMTAVRSGSRRIQSRPTTCALAPMVDYG
jgi:gluconolactonase